MPGFVPFSNLLGQAATKILRQAVKKISKEESVIKILKDLGFKITPEKNFKSIYIHSFINYGIGKEKGLLELFILPDVQKALYRELFENKPNALKYELSYQLNKNPKTNLLKEKGLKEVAVKEIHEFIKEFLKQINITRTPDEKETHLLILSILQHIDLLSSSLTPEKLSVKNQTNSSSQEVFEELQEVQRAINSVMERTKQIIIHGPVDTFIQVNNGPINF